MHHQACKWSTAYRSCRMSSRGPVPRAGENVEFDRYFNRLMDGKDADETDFAESRRYACYTCSTGTAS